MSALIKVGVMEGDTAPWEYIARTLLSEGIRIELVTFSSFFAPNRALAEGQIDLNAFQHKAFLNQEIADHHYDLVPIAVTYLDPIGFYSKKIRSLSELKNGDKLVIPADPANAGRSLKDLDEAAVIRTDRAKGYMPDISDVVENRLNLQFVKVEPAKTILSLDEEDITGAFINGNYAFEGGLNATTDAVYREKLSADDISTPFVKVLVVRNKDKDRYEFKRIIDTYHSKESAEVLKQAEGGALIPAFKVY